MATRFNEGRHEGVPAMGRSVFIRATCALSAPLRSVASRSRRAKIRSPILKWWECAMDAVMRQSPGKLGTEARIYAKNLAYEIARRERIGASALDPGGKATTWRDAQVALRYAFMDDRLDAVAALVLHAVDGAADAGIQIAVEIAGEERLHLGSWRQEVEPGIIGGRVEGHWLAVMGLPHRIVSSWVMIVPCKLDQDVRRVTALQRPQRPG